MIKDINGNTIPEGAKVKTKNGYEYILEYDSDVDMWELVEYCCDGERIKAKIADYFSGELTIID